MFKNLEDTIKTLNADVKNVANCEKAKKLRKKLLSIGLTLAIVGFLGVFACFVSFAITSFNPSMLDDSTIGLIIPYILFIPFGIIASIGSAITSLGFKIIITGYTTNLINETVGNNCPNCGETFSSEMIFCSKCGTKLKNECPNCKHINSYKSSYCEKCGTKLK